MNKFKSLILVAALALGFTATRAAGPDVYVQNVPYGTTWNPPPPGPGCTSVNVDVLGFSVWDLTVQNNTAFTQVNWSISVKHVHDTSTTVSSFTGGGTSNFGSATIASGASFVIEDNMNVGTGITYTAPADIALWSSAPAVTPSYHLEYITSGITVPTTSPWSSNLSTITVTYTYGVTTPPDDDDCDDDRGHGRGHHNKRGNKRR